MKKTILIILTIALLNGCNTMGYYSEGNKTHYDNIQVINTIYDSNGFVVQETINRDDLTIVVSYDKFGRVMKEKISNGESYIYIYYSSLFSIEYYANDILISSDTYEYID